MQQLNNEQRQSIKYQVMKKKYDQRKKKWKKTCCSILIISMIFMVSGVLWWGYNIMPIFTSPISAPAISVSCKTLKVDYTELIELTNRVSFLAVGDNLGHMTVNNYADKLKGSSGDGQYDYLPLYENVSDIISEVDLAFINQETMITGDERGISGYPLFNSPEAWARDVVELGFDIVNAASNHTLDKGVAGIEGAAKVWSQYEDITYVGAYTSQEDADEIRLVERDGITFAILAYTYGTNGISRPNDFCVYILDEEKIKSDVAKAKEISDVVIISSHWGDEGALKPNETQKKYAQIFADAEVDIVVGHHSHTVQPITWVEGVNGNETLVVYGLGNFISTMTSVDNQLEIMLTLDFVQRGDEVTIENIVAIPMVNHYDTNGAVEVYFLEDYTNELINRHRNLKGKMPDVLAYYDTKLSELIPEEFLYDKDKSIETATDVMGEDEE